MLIYSSDASGDLTAEAPGTLAAPQIVGQPVDQLVSAGDFASFSVVVANTSGVTFQWAFKGTDIAGASGDSLLLPAVSAANVGPYSVTVTNSAGSVTSSVAALALDSGVSTASFWGYFLGRFSSAEDSLLGFRAVSDEWILAELQAGRFAHRVVGNTAGFGNINDGRPSWVGDFTGAGRSQVLFYSPGDFNWWLASVDAAGELKWSLIGNTSFGPFINVPFGIGDFTGAGRSQVLFYSPGDFNWWLGSVDAGELNWSLIGNTAGFGQNINDGRPFWIGDFTGAGPSQVLFYSPGDFNWWLGSVDATGKLKWSLIGNTAAQFSNGFNDVLFWIGDFTGAGRSQVLFFSPFDSSWWLGSVDAAGELKWSLIYNTAGFGRKIKDGLAEAAGPFWIGDFTGAGRSQVLFYSPDDFNWWLGSVDATGKMLQWSLVDNWAGFGQIVNDGRPFWIGDLTGAGHSQVLFHSPGNDNWWLGSVDAAGKLQWSLIDNTAG